VKNILALFVVLLVSACGGGGGGGSGSNAGGGSPAAPAPSATGLTVTFNKSSLSFDYLEGSQPTPQVIQAAASGTTTKDVLMGAEINGPGIATPISVVVDLATRTGTITVTPASGLAAGTYTGTIKLLACADQACTVHHGGSPYTVGYTVNVRPGLKPSVTSLNLAATETGASSSSTITFTPPASNAAVSASVNYLNGTAGWLNAQITGNTVQVQASAVSLSPGTYQAELLLSEPLSHQTVTIPVKLTVGSGLTVAESGAIQVGSATTAQQLQGSVALALAPGAAATSWSASSDQAWLKLTRASGDFSTQPSWTIDVAAFGALPNNAHYTAKVQITTDSKLPAKTYTLDAYKGLAEIKGLDALALLPGQSGDVLVYGSGFSTLPAGLNGVSVSGVQPTAATVLNDKVLRLTLPVVQAGRYGVTLKSASGMSTASKNIVVTPRATYAYQAFDTQGLKTTMVWDAVSKSAFVVNSTLKSVMRYADVGGRFQLVNTRSFPAVDSIAMTPDHTALVLQSAGSTIYKLSPTDLSTLATFSLSTYSDTSTSYSTPLTIVGDNRLMHATYGWVDLDTGATKPVLFQQYNGFGGSASWAAVSGNGMRMIRPDSGMYSPRGPMYHADVTNDAFVAYNSSLTPYFYRYAVNHDGTVWSLEGQVVDFDLNLLGYATLPDGWLSNQAAMSRDGTRLYHYAQSASFGTKPRIYVFDTSKAQTTQVNLPVLGYIEFDDLPNCPYNQNGGYYDQCYTFESRIVISDDGRTLFVVGDRKFVVVPIPSTMTPLGISPRTPASSAWARLPATGH
jgi:hypothetical protein